MYHSTAPNVTMEASRDGIGGLGVRASGWDFCYVQCILLILNTLILNTPNPKIINTHIKKACILKLCLLFTGWGVFSIRAKGLFELVLSP